MSGDPDYRMLRRFATKAARRDRNHYRSDMVSRMETAVRLGDNRKLFRLFNATMNRGTISDMAKLIHEAPSVAPDITDMFAEPYACNCEPSTEEEIISVINKLKVNKAPGEDILRLERLKEIK
ncbi:unnamed protein product [Dracunculus medinensis]|uniref:RPOL4c domain-containing protein n=1 Tax=Dracunculus medinensis TaxID=318479 RepID=A0A0N4U2G7_DRAME|nr:unnamed protein product [Dracunculus medinensis]